MIRRSKSRRTRKRSKKRSMRGGNVSLDFKKPEVSSTSSGDAIQGAMNKQKADNESVVEMNKAMAGGGIVVPQMAQAGGDGNESIAGTIGSTLQGRADGEYDNDVYKGGRRRRSRRGGKNSPEMKVNPCDTQLDRCLREIILDRDGTQEDACYDNYDMCMDRPIGMLRAATAGGRRRKRKSRRKARRKSRRSRKSRRRRRSRKRR